MGETHPSFIPNSPLKKQEGASRLPPALGHRTPETTNPNLKIDEETFLM